MDIKLAFAKLKKNQDLFFLLAILFLGLIPRVYFLFAEKRILWDSAVYIGMGKYIFSLGANGLFENLRPLIWPMILGFFWKIGTPIVFFSKLLQMMFSIGIVVLVYRIGERLEKNVGLISAGVVFLTPFFIFYEHWGLSEIPAAFFGLLAVYLFFEKRLFWAGFASGIAFLTKFPNGLVFGGLFIALIYANGINWKRNGILFAGFFIPTKIYLLLNAFMYDHPFVPFQIGNEVINTAGVWLYNHGWQFYFKELFNESFLFIFVILGIYYVLKHRETREAAILFIFLLLFTYFTYMVHKEIRFAILFLPYLGILVGYGIVHATKGMTRIQAFSIALVVLFLFAQQFKDNMTLYDRVEGAPDYILQEEYYSYLSGVDVVGEVWVSDPKFALYLDKPLELVYYPVFNQKYINNLNAEFVSRDIDYVFLNTCDVVCAPGDNACETEKGKMLKFLETMYERVKTIVQNNCEYRVYKSEY